MYKGDHCFFPLQKNTIWNHVFQKFAERRRVGRQKVMDVHWHGRGGLNILKEKSVRAYGARCWKCAQSCILLWDGGNDKLVYSPFYL